MMTFCFRIRLADSARMRKPASAGPPGAHGMMSLIGFSGNFGWAIAGAANGRTAAPAKAARRLRRIMRWNSLLAKSQHGRAKAASRPAGRGATWKGPARPRPEARIMAAKPTVMPVMYGITGRKPKLAVEAVTMTTFGPGVNDIASENRISG